MKIKLANYISETLVQNGITQNFSVTGGGAMHLNDAFGHQKGMHTLYQHHEQACAMAAESYARIYNRPALLCVTSGPGGTNAITGVLGAWLDSIPMLIISGQVRYDNTARWACAENGVRLRAMGDQEFEITKSIDCMTKYAEMLTDPYRIRYVLEKCIYLCQTGRPGPCWLDIPVDLQGCTIETDELIGFDLEDYVSGGDGWALSENGASRCRRAFAAGAASEANADGRRAEMAASHRMPADSAVAGREAPVPPVDPHTVQMIIARIRESRRPIFYTGNGIRIAGAEAMFLELAHVLGIPVVVSWNAPDIIPTDDPLYVGRPGGRGDRPGNLAVQNADLILSIGSRLNIRQVGYNFRTWAREAYVIVNDIDAEELRKPSVHCDLPVHADARALIKALCSTLYAMGYTDAHPLFCGGEGMRRADAVGICHTEEARALLQDIASQRTACGSADTETDPQCTDEKNGPQAAQPGADDRLRWTTTCAFYRDNYPTVLPAYLAPHDPAADPADPAHFANVYALIKEISDQAAPGQVTVVGNGSPCVAGGQAYRIKAGSRFISQDAVASMGYDLPAAIGAAVAVHAVAAAVPADERLRETRDAQAGVSCAHDYTALAMDPSIHESMDERLRAELRDPYWSGREEHYPAYEKHDILLLTGDGSIQMNLQELQTIISHRLPIKIFVINNGGYHSIRQTQQNLFRGEPLVGIGEDSGLFGQPDLSFPDMEKLAAAYGYPFLRASHNEELPETVRRTLEIDGPAICEIMVTRTQQFLPKSAARKLPDGSIVSPPLEDLAPYLPEDEMDKLMLIRR